MLTEVLAPSTAHPYVQVVVERGPLGPVVSVRGELDSCSCPTVRDVLDEALREHPTKLVVDLAGVTFVGAAALRTFVGVNHDAAMGGTVLELANVPEQVRRRLALTAESRLLRVVP